MPAHTVPPAAASNCSRAETACREFLRDAGYNPVCNAGEARQVVVFTHDMVFFAKLADAADKAKTEITTHWIQRSGDNKPGLVSLNDGPATTHNMVRLRLWQRGHR